MNTDQSQKTQKPTPKRIKDFRDKGEIALSRDLAQTASTVGGGLGLAIGASASANAIADLTRQSLAAAGGGHVGNLTSVAGSTFLVCLVPVAVGALCGYLVAAALQLGWPPAFKRLGFDLGKLFTVSNIGQLISPKAAAGRVLKAAAKVTVVGAAVVLALYFESRELLSRPNLEPHALLLRSAIATARVCAYAVSALAVLALIDYGLARRRIGNKMMMSPDELKREHKEQEGDPHMKAARKRKMKEASSRRHAIDVPRADVVLVNPTEYAVALRYDADAGGAPRVVAKGRLAVAARIREMARKAGVPIIKRPPLTRLIYRTVREGQEVPTELYQVVAEILAYVYRLRKRMA